jgi:hypothetical protein
MCRKKPALVAASASKTSEIDFEAPGQVPVSFRATLWVGGLPNASAKLALEQPKKIARLPDPGSRHSVAIINSICLVAAASNRLATLGA